MGIGGRAKEKEMTLSRSLGRHGGHRPLNLNEGLAVGCGSKRRIGGREKRKVGNSEKKIPVEGENYHE